MILFLQRCGLFGSVSLKPRFLHFDGSTWIQSYCCLSKISARKLLLTLVLGRCMQKKMWIQCRSSYSTCYHLSGMECNPQIGGWWQPLWEVTVGVSPWMHLLYSQMNDLQICLLITWEHLETVDYNHVLLTRGGVEEGESTMAIVEAGEARRLT